MNTGPPLTAPPAEGPVPVVPATKAHLTRKLWADILLIAGIVCGYIIQISPELLRQHPESKWLPALPLLVGGIARIIQGISNRNNTVTVDNSQV